MSDQIKKPNPSKSAPPKKPLVAQSRPMQAAEEAPPRRQPPYMRLAGSGLLLLLVVLLWWAHATFRHSQAQLASGGESIAGGSASSAENLPIAPGVIATTQEVAQPWAAKNFLMRDPITGKTSPAMLVHLNGNDYWAFSLQEPFGICQLEYVTDLSRLQSYYNYSAAHPMVGDPCKHTVFDLTQYGGGPNGDVRGAIVSGVGVRPPVAIEIEVQGGKILATRSE